MSILIASSAFIAQLCYVAENDIGAHEFLNEAQRLHTPLLAMINAKESGCIEINDDDTYNEAQKLVSADSSQNTLKLQE